MTGKHPSTHHHYIPPSIQRPTPRVQKPKPNPLYSLQNLIPKTRREAKAKKELEAAASSPPAAGGGRGMSRRGGLVSTRQSIRPSSRDGFSAGRGGRGLGLGALSGRGPGSGDGGGSELKPLGIGFNEGLLARRALITVGPDDDDDDSDDEWDEQGAVSSSRVPVSRESCLGFDSLGVGFCSVCLQTSAVNVVPAKNHFQGGGLLLLHKHLSSSLALPYTVTKSAAGCIFVVIK